LNFDSGPVRLVTVRAAKAQYRNRPIAIGTIVNDAVDADVCHVLAAAAALISSRAICFGSSADFRIIANSVPAPLIVIT
jgi:hypothetical protein